MNRISSRKVLQPLRIIGVIFSAMGGFFLVLGIALNALLFEDSVAFLLSFGGMGLVFLIIGLCFLGATARKDRLRERLIAEGDYVRAEITGTECCYNIMVNGHSPYVVNCRYKDTDGTVHIFKSDYLGYDPTGIFTSSTVMVYVDKSNFSKYYVDTASALPRVEIH